VGLDICLHKRELYDVHTYVSIYMHIYGICSYIFTYACIGYLHGSVGHGAGGIAHRERILGPREVMPYIVTYIWLYVCLCM
jgi:hypothetical protein